MTGAAATPTPRKRVQPRRARRAGRGALMALAALLAGSGAIRFGEGVDRAFALSVELPADQADADQICEPTAGALAMLEALKAREMRLAERESVIDERGQALALAETKVAAQLTALVAAEAELGATITQAEEAAEGDIAKLTAVYENMKPKLAAPVFEQMAPEFAAGFLGQDCLYDQRSSGRAQCKRTEELASQPQRVC